MTASFIRVRSRRWRRRIAVAAAFLAADPAAAQWAGQVSLDSDDRFRARSISGGQPAGTVELSFDGGGGPYVGGSLTAALAAGTWGDVLSGQAYAGYARRLSAQTSADIGFVETQYTRQYAGGRAERFAEAYIGLSRGNWSGHLRYSPDYVGLNYYGYGSPALYAELDFAREFAPSWHLSSHAGLLAQTAGLTPAEGRLHYDLRLGVARTLGHAELHASFVAGGPGGQYLLGVSHGRSALVFGISRTF